MPQMNFYDGRLVKENDRYVIEVQGARIVPSEDKQARLKERNTPEMEITVGARPEHISLKKTEGAMIDGVVDVSEMMGSSVHLHLNAGGTDSIVIVPTLELGDQFPKIGTVVPFTFAPNVVHMFDKQSGKNLEYL